MSSLASVARQHLGLPKKGHRPANASDLVGEVFGRLTVIRFLTTRKCGKRVWLCLCECGGLVKVVTGDLRAGKTKSCGCLVKDLNAQRKTHGMSHTRTFDTWHSVLQRCENPSHSDYASYGGRGIRLCERWHDFQNFVDDLGPCPDGYLLGRKDRDGDYTPENCQWISRAQEARNRESNLVIEFNGEKRTKREWAERIGITRSQLSRRLRNLPLEDALTLPKRGSGRKKRHYTVKR